MLIYPMSEKLKIKKKKKRKKDILKLRAGKNHNCYHHYMSYLSLENNRF